MARYSLFFRKTPTNQPTYNAEMTECEARLLAYAGGGGGGTKKQTSSRCTTKKGEGSTETSVNDHQSEVAAANKTTNSDDQLHIGCADKLPPIDTAEASNVSATR